MAVTSIGQDVTLRRGLRSRQSRSAAAEVAAATVAAVATRRRRRAAGSPGRSCRRRASSAAASTRARGTNPANGLPYTDIRGTCDRREQLAALVEQRALPLVQRDRRSRSRVCTRRRQYFDLLEDDATTPSGSPKDRFHFTYSTSEWLALVAVGHGSRLRRRLVRRRAARRRGGSSWPIRIRTRRRRAGSQPAARRGSRCSSMASTSSTPTRKPTIDTFVAGLYPDQPGENHTFVLRDPQTGSQRTVTLTSANVTIDPVQNVSMISTPTGTRRLHPVQRSPPDRRAAAHRRVRAAAPSRTSRISCSTCATTAAVCWRSRARSPT